MNYWIINATHVVGPKLEVVKIHPPASSDARKETPTMTIDIQGPALSFDPCPQINALARDVYAGYGEGIIIPVETLRAWRDRNPEVFWVATDGPDVVAYLSLLPLDEAAFERTLATDFNEANDVKPEVIVPYGTGGAHQAFLSSIVVREDLRGTGVSRHLRLALLNRLLEWWRQGRRVTRVSAEVLSPGGSAMVRSLGLVEHGLTDHKTSLYLAEVTPALLESRRDALGAKLGA